MLGIGAQAQPDPCQRPSEAFSEDRTWETPAIRQPAQAIEAAIEPTPAVAGARPVAVVAEYPAHLPEVVVDKAALTSVIASLIAHAMGPWRAGEIKVRAAALSEVEVPVGSGELPGRAAEAGRGGSRALVRVPDLRALCGRDRPVPG